MNSNRISTIAVNWQLVRFRPWAYLAHFVTMAFFRHYRNLTGRRGTKTGAVARRSGIKPRERASQARVENESRWQNRARDVVVEAQLAIRQNRELESELDRRIVPRSKVQAEIV